MSIYDSNNFIPTYLYIKQHNKTSLKYFGKTIKSDPTKYRGSGLYSNKHLKKHGNDVTTIWYQLFENKEALIKFAINFSKTNNIADSKEWANIIPETGVGGNILWCKETSKRWNLLTDEEKQNKNKIDSECLKHYWKNVPDNERKNRIKKGAIGVKKHWDNSTLEERKARAIKSGIGHKGKRMMQSPDKNIKPQIIMLKDQAAKLAEGWFYPILKWKPKYIASNNLRRTYVPKKKECPYCGKYTDPGNYSQYHGEKCKFKK